MGPLILSRTMVRASVVAAALACVLITCAADLDLDHSQTVLGTPQARTDSTLPAEFSGRVRDSHQLSSSNELGEEHNTEPKTNAAAASNGKILFYQRQLRLEQQKCPNSALKCPSSASAAKKSNQWKQTKTGKQARNAQLQEACDYHLGLAAKSWVKPYRKAVLDSSLRNIMHNRVRVDCNPASCDNPRVCGIPPCRGIPTEKNGRRNPDYWKATNKKTCPAAKGCGIQTAAVSRDMPSKPKWKYLVMSQPATRVGTMWGPAYTPGIVSCYPTFSKIDRHGYVGSWMMPGAGNCNPYQLMACTKGSIAHTALPPQLDNSNRYSALLFVKRTWCIKGECDRSDCPARCYTFKRGQCLRFHKKVMPPYASNAGKYHSKEAYKELVAGRFSTKCTPKAARAARAMLAGN